MLPLLVLTSLAAPPPPCTTPDALAALSGRALPTHPHMLAAPANLDGRPRPRADGKSVYGGHYEHFVDTDNFTIGWWDASIDPAAAETAAEALEDAWAAFVQEQGWTPPVSSDRYLLWVLLDPSMSGTGFTTEYVTDEFPQGYPVIYLNPAWATQPEFWGSLAAHEFMHALQYALREWDGSAPSEAWYWEASASWASEIAEPDRDGFQYSSAWYAEQPQLSYDSMAGSHQYGMFTFNAWMEEALTGPGGMKAVWDRSATDDAAWDDLLEASTGVNRRDLWGGFTGAYGNEQLADAALYTRVAFEGAAEDGAVGTLAELGTHYYRVREPIVVTATGDVVLSGPDGHGDRVVLDAGDRLAVTAVTAGDYTLSVEAYTPEDTGGDTAVAEDDGSAGDDADAEPLGGCGCGGGAGAIDAIGAAAAALTVLARRRGASRPA